MRLEGVRAIVFDLDDTLYAEREYTRSGARAVAEILGEPGALAELLALEREDPRRPLYSDWLERRGLDIDRQLPEILAIHRRHRPDIRLSPGIRALLVRLRGSFRLGLVSDGRRTQQRAKAEALGLHGLLDPLVFSDELGRECWKPHPAPYWTALERLGVAPSEAIYVGDNPAKDFLGARNAGMRSVRLRRPDGLHATDEPGGADCAPNAEIHDLLQLEDLLLPAVDRARDDNPWDCLSAAGHPS